MPDLYHTLLKYDAGFITIAADLWGLEINSREHDPAVQELCNAILDHQTVQEMLEVLPPNARASLSALIESGGRMEWAAFARKFGEIREMGSAKRDREQPHLHPVSSSEILYYRVLLARAFLESRGGAQEFAYIPKDLLPLLKDINRSSLEKEQSPGRPATQFEKAIQVSANDQILDDTTTLLAALRIAKEDFTPDPHVMGLLESARITRNAAPQSEAVRSFLEAPRREALHFLQKAWMDSSSFNELRLIPEIVCEGEWKNDPRGTRKFLLEVFGDLPKNRWWSLQAFLQDIKTRFPDFQRPAGDYDSWFIKRASDGQYLRGFACWDQVDGAVIKMIVHMLHKLGMADVALSEKNGPIAAFRLSSFQAGEEKGKIGIASNGTITLPGSFPRAIRYQLARFCEWDEKRGGDFIYHISARSLRLAGGQGLKAEQLLTLLVKHTKGKVPPAVVESLKRWDLNGPEARLESQILLRIARPEVMENLRKSKAGRFLGELITPTIVVVKAGAVEKVLAALSEMGVFAEVEKVG